jgi:hypothetical protein
MKKVFILFATLLVSQVVIASNVICGESQAELISEFERTRRVPIYNPRGKIDPFQPIFNNEPTKQAPKVHQTDCISNPVLEGVDMSQLKLTGIVMTERQPIALVQEAPPLSLTSPRFTFACFTTEKALITSRTLMLFREALSCEKYLKWWV